MGGDRQETCKQITLSRGKYYEENKWARERLREDAASDRGSGKAFPE